MDVKKFQESRESTLKTFQTKFNEIQTTYNSTILAAIQETDPDKQNTLVEQILSLNTQMSNELKDILATLNAGNTKFSPTTLNELTEKLIQYQKQYDEINKGKDRVQTLQMILTTTRKKLHDTVWMYNFYLAALLLLICIIIFMIIKNSVVSAVSLTGSS